MLIPIIISGLASAILLLPLCLRWRLPIHVTLPVTFLTGGLSAMLVRALREVYKGMNTAEGLAINFLLILILPLSLLLWRFYRDPERCVPENVDCICSPADGIVIYTQNVGPGSIPYSIKHESAYSLLDFVQPSNLPCEGYLIGISMNFMDVHVNRAPIEGTVTHFRHIKGTHLSLGRPDAPGKNERALTVIRNDSFSVAVVQIASRLVRSIVPYIAEGAQVTQGQRIGIIRFGSQVDLFLPKLPSIHVEAKRGQKLRAGASVIARIG